LAARVASLPSLCAAVAPVDPARLVLSHRDLHPGNVLVDGGGTLVVLDWDNLGPTDPARELASALFDWWCDPGPDEPAMRKMYEAYVRSGGPARVTEPADFTMLLAARLNFLRIQIDVLLDETSAAEHRRFAEQEVDESLRILPTPAHLAGVLELARSLNRDP
jgi:aminoglycoside phosphotransferase (APT) family kinase protein